VRFTDSGEVMSASTDSTLRLWDLPSQAGNLPFLPFPCQQQSSYLQTVASPPMQQLNLMTSQD
jgi:WD40 repeat protein